MLWLVLALASIVAVSMVALAPRKQSVYRPDAAPCPKNLLLQESRIGSVTGACGTTCEDKSYIQCNFSKAVI